MSMPTSDKPEPKRLDWQNFLLKKQEIYGVGAKKQTILVVDDTSENLRLLAEILTEQGYRVRSAPNGRRALATVEKELPDLILLDIMMPEMDGYEVCQRLKANEKTSDIPVIFLSALNEVFDKMTAFSVGGVDYIGKPFQTEEVLARVRTHLSLQEMRQTLQQQNQQLQLQNSELDAFAHTVAHDLKNPVAQLSMALSFIVQEGAEFDEDLQEVLRLGLSANHKMNSIIEELLLLATVRKENVRGTPLNMTTIVEQALRRISHMVDKYEPEITLPPTWPIAIGYAAWIEEVWVNYLSNGLKYGGEPPHLALGATPESDGTIRFWVKDNGPGLSPAQQAKLFTEFTRLDKVRAKGHGLGLSIVRRIMDKLGGTCGVEGEPEQGSLFYFTLSAKVN